jgi:hypothetical protein
VEQSSGRDRLNIRQRQTWMAGTSPAMMGWMAP